MKKIIRNLIRNKHSLRMFDTGMKPYRYDGEVMRNDGWHFCVWTASTVLFIVGFLVFLVNVLSAYDFTGLVVSLIFMGIPLVVAFLYATHRNFGLDAKSTKVMDAIYRLDKKERKEYGIRIKDVEGMSQDLADALVKQIDKYLINRAKTSGVGNLFEAMKSYNETMEEHFAAERAAEAEARGRMKQNRDY